MILKCAGYRIASTNNLSQAISLTLDISPNLIILGHSFSDNEQETFVDELSECQPGTYVLCLKFGLVDPMTLLKECKSILSAHPGCAPVRALRSN